MLLSIYFKENTKYGSIHLEKLDKLNSCVGGAGACYKSLKRTFDTLTILKNYFGIYILLESNNINKFVTNIHSLSNLNRI